MRTGTIPNLSTLRMIDDHAAFSRLPVKVQDRVKARLAVVEQVLAAGHGSKGDATAAGAVALSVSIPTVLRFCRDYRKHGWKALSDKRGKKTRDNALPAEFKLFVRQLHLLCQRSTTGREVQRTLIERWKAWQRTGEARFAIPGYDEPPPASAKGYPRGWSEDQICKLRPEDYALSVARQGSKNAAGYLPSILKTRVGVKFGAVVFFDDSDSDLKIAAPGTSQRSLRPQGFYCLDYLSGCFMQHGSRLRWWDGDAEKYRTLTQAEFVWFVVSYLQRHGYRSDATGTCLVWEHGTANGYNNKSLSTCGGHSNFDEALAAVSHGCIRVERSGLFDSPAFAGLLFRPQSSGNPNRKAPIESMFSLVRSRMAALPGATGRNRDLKPAEQYGQDLYTGQLLKLWERLDERHRELIQWPILTAQEFGEIEATIFRAINNRTDHALEGWEKLGFVAPQLRFTADERSPWYSRREIIALPESARSALLALSDVPGHVRTYKLSPADVVELHAGELTKLPDEAVPFLIPMQWAREATVKSDRTLSIKDQLLGPEAFVYLCRIETADGAFTLKPGMKVLCYLNPFAPERLVICREDGSFLGTLNQMTRAGWQDHAAILEQLKGVAELKADLDAGVRPHLEGLMSDRAEMKRANGRLADGKPVLPEDVAAARSAAGVQGQRTAAANRLQGHGEAVDWDAEPMAETASADPFADLPDDSPEPETL